MSPQYKLIYFNLAGRAETIRYIFAYANQDFEDKRINREEWSALKPNTPLGQVPVLEIDGKQYPQGIAISRYLAKKFGLLGKDDLEAFQADIVVDTLSDMKAANMKEMMEKDEAKKAEASKQRDFLLEKLEKNLSQNPSGYFVGSQITYADLTAAATLSDFLARRPEVLAPYPNLVKLIGKINSIPSIKAYLEKRPASDPPPHRK